MPREKKDAKNFACKFDRVIFEKLEEFCRLSGQSKTTVVERAVQKYLDTKDIYIGKPNDQGLADFARVDKKKINQLMRDASSESNSLGSYIFELLSGGEDEIAILMNYLEK